MHRNERASQASSSASIIVSVHKTSSCLVRMLFVSSTISNIPDPRRPRHCSRQSLEWVGSLALSGNISLGHREIPSANVFCPPGICFSLRFHSPASSRRPSILVSRQALSSVAPPLRDTHDTVAMLSPRIIIGSPAASGLSPTNFSHHQRGHDHSQ